MVLTINDKEHTFFLETAKISDILDQLKKNPKLLIVEHNGSLYKEDRFRDIDVNNGDRLEVIQFVGGGS